MNKIKEAYQLFRECFPSLAPSFESFCALLPADASHIRVHYENDTPAGCAVTDKNRIALLCVSPLFERMGIGSGLLKECEESIFASGHDKVILGTDGWFFLGAVLKQNEHESPFFAKRGYCFHDCCEELSMKACDIGKSGYVPVNAEYRFIRPEEHDAVIRAVAQVDEDWCRYFSDDSTTFAAFVDGEIASFCIAENSCTTLITSEGSDIGSVGCVGTVPSMRKHGYGLSMVEKASELLRDRGCTDVYIHYTSLGKWYGALGFRPLIRFGMGEKNLK